MVKKAIHTWQVTSEGNNKSKFILHADITLGGVMGFVMLPMMKIMMGKMMGTMTEDFKHYVETGNPSKPKLKAIQKFKK